MILKIVLFFALIALSCETKILDKEEFVCEPGMNYKENNCNSCKCHIPTGGLSCTRMMCPSSNDITLTDCTVGTAWTKGCNRCWCVKDFGTVCTTYHC